MLSLIDAASHAQWFGAAEVYWGAEPVRLGFGPTSVPAARDGVVARSRDLDSLLENWSDASYLHTHPAWQRRGKIVGLYPPYRVSEGDTFSAQVGFVSGARGSDGVVFIFGIIPDSERPPETKDFFERGNTARLRERFIELARIDKVYDGRLREMSVGLARFAGQTVRPVLIVEAGESSGQDWAAWSQPTIDARREIAFTGFQCNLESTSGRSDFRRRRRRRRSWNSDEFALLVQVLGFNERSDEQRYEGAQFRATTSVDSGESFSFSPMVFGFAPSEVSHLEVRMVGLEIDGAGETEYLADYALSFWAGTTFLTSDGSRSSFNSAYNPGPRSGNVHNLLATDYWRVDTSRMLSGGVEPSGIHVGGSSPGSVDEYLGEQGIIRTIIRASFEDLTMESRRYQSSSHYSDYVINISYR
ncbi:hypothetical protein JHW45_08170 [Paracoccus stylophorae]|uniref:Uncharacterized protein n=1 Tax=Paracoccus stylophorae TaxID=659350 RepID=A0ABY7SYW7_9RHOB|nr:hypothetical protein [Paracoccus stylophorae]WCR12275.1 hypothetical protein JHW45_08170 [Paracoccus stylophorae]